MPAESIRSLYFPISNHQQHPREGHRNFEIKSQLNTSSSNFERSKPLQYVQFMFKLSLPRMWNSNNAVKQNLHLAFCLLGKVIEPSELDAWTSIRRHISKQRPTYRLTWTIFCFLSDNNHKLWKFSGFHGGYRLYDGLRKVGMQYGRNLPTFRRNIVPPSSGYPDDKFPNTFQDALSQRTGFFTVTEKWNINSNSLSRP